MLAMADHPLEHIPASFPSGLRWYVFYSHVRAEKKAGDEIRQLEFPVFVPLEHFRNKAPRALFPRYGFCQFDIHNPDWGNITSCKGVIDLVRVNHIPRHVPDQVIAGIRLAEGMGMFDHTRAPKVGTKVEVMEGPFAGEIGRICNIPSSRRARVLLQWLGGERVVSMPLAGLREA